MNVRNMECSKSKKYLTGLSKKWHQYLTLLRACSFLRSEVIHFCGSSRFGQTSCLYCRKLFTLVTLVHLAAIVSHFDKTIVKTQLGWKLVNILTWKCFFHMWPITANMFSSSYVLFVRVHMKEYFNYCEPSKQVMFHNKDMS